MEAARENYAYTLLLSPDVFSFGDTNHGRVKCACVCLFC